MCVVEVAGLAALTKGRGDVSPVPAIAIGSARVEDQHSYPPLGGTLDQCTEAGVAGGLVVAPGVGRHDDVRGDVEGCVALEDGVAPITVLCRQVCAAVAPRDDRSDLPSRRRQVASRHQHGGQQVVAAAGRFVHEGVESHGPRRYHSWHWNCVVIPRRSNVDVVDQLRAELRATLVDLRETAAELLSRLDDPEAPPVEVVGLLESLGSIDRTRADLLGQFQEMATRRRLREEERSIRRFVLGALGEIGTPQTAGFLEDYLYARDLVLFRSRGVGALRRDELRAWDRDRASDRRRPAYIAACLDEQGQPVTGWMTRSDWPLPRRLLVPGAEELWSVSRVKALVAAYRDATEEAGPLFESLIERYASESFDADEVERRLNQANRYDEFEQAADERIAQLTAPVETAQTAAAARLSDRSEEQLLWGQRR